MYANVIVDISNEAVDRAYTYRIPEGMLVSLGDKVEIPFGKMRTAKSGYVISIFNETSLPDEKIKNIYGSVKGSIGVQGQLLSLALWMSKTYGTTINQCLKTVLPVKRTIRKNSRRVDPLQSYKEYKEDKRPSLNDEQQKARDAIILCCKKCYQAFKCDNDDKENKFENQLLENNENKENKENKNIKLEKVREIPRLLLFGITGSGKTEVYLNAMEEVISSGKQVIFLIPEISLAFQMVLRISARFRGRTAILHSRMSQGERFEQYEKCRKGEVDILVGPRSALFAPFSDIGLIIMDEEHESAYKSETSPRYEAREVAAKRAEISGCPVLYGSATPSLRIFSEALSGSVQLLCLEKRASPGSMLPESEIVDLREELLNGNRSVFSNRLKLLMEDRLKKNEQILLFINRRGYSSFLSCRRCGEAIKCPHCDVTLTLHNDGMLRCHYCGYQRLRMSKCPVCDSPYLAPFGIGTEQLEKLTKETFPGARVLRMDADTTSGKGGYDRILSDFHKHEADILIGTQMIVKGHDFPDVTLVGLIAADLSLFVPDFMAQERTFQIITQAAGRAGRSSKNGTVIIQTYQPEHYAIVLAKTQNYRLFYQKEMNFRRMLSYPPVEYMLGIQLSSGSEELLIQISERSVLEFQDYCLREGAELIGPLRESVYKVKDIFRKIVYIKHSNHDIITRLRSAFAIIVHRNDRMRLINISYDIQ